MRDTLDLDFLVYMCNITMTSNTLPAHLLYIASQSGLPIGYYKVIRGWWNRRYDAEEAKRLLEEIDGGKAFRHHLENYIEQREKILSAEV